MATTHSPRERYQLYRMGWRDGAGSKGLHPEKMRDRDYCDGYERGRKDFNEAMEHARQRLGAPPPSILRAQDGLQVNEKNEESVYPTVSSVR